MILYIFLRGLTWFYKIDRFHVQRSNTYLDEKRAKRRNRAPGRTTESPVRKQKRYRFEQAFDFARLTVTLSSEFQCCRGFAYSRSTAPMDFVAAITIGVRILGPALGFILGSLCTMIYADLSANPQITPTDPRWVGAWWLGKLKFLTYCPTTASF